MHPFHRGVRPCLDMAASLASAAPAAVSAAAAAPAALAQALAAAPAAAAALAAPAAAAAPSPLVEVLGRAVAAGKVVRDPLGEVYTGFGIFSDLAASQCAFVPMNSNRAINMDVVAQRVQENIDAYERTGRYLEFGQINLIVVAPEATHDFLVMDGQHRCETMRELHRRFPARELCFQFRAKVVASEVAAFDELRHFQRAFPTDPRSFFRSRAEARAATGVLQRLKIAHAPAFREMVLADRRGRSAGDPCRPYLNDSLVFWLIQDAGFASGAEGGEDAPEADGVTTHAGTVLAELARADALLATLPLEALGKGATVRMRQMATRAGCWLGFLREGLLHWRDLQPQLAVQAALPAVPAVPPGAEAVVAECTVCLSCPPASALLPCGHRCVCEACAAAVLAARPLPPRCPLCRGAVEGACRIYL